MTQMRKFTNAGGRFFWEEVDWLPEQIIVVTEKWERRQLLITRHGKVRVEGGSTSWNTDSRLYRLDENDTSNEV